MIAGRTRARVTAERILAIGRTARPLQTFVFVDTLAVIHVLDITLGTGAPVSSHGVHTSGLTSSVIDTLVRIKALGAGGIQLESTWTHALETTKSVDTLGWRHAVTRLNQALVDIDALIVDLRVTVGAGTFITSGGVDAFVLAVMLASSAFIQIPA